MLPSIKELVTGKVRFAHYQNGELWYVCENCETFLFPVPVSETNEAKFLAEDKGILYMRWIKRQHAILEMENKSKNS